MLVSEDGALLALQPTSDGEETALNRLREIYRRATQYQLPAPYWERPGEHGLDADGADVLVVPDGMAGATDAEGEATAAARTDDAENRFLYHQVSAPELDPLEAPGNEESPA